MLREVFASHLLDLVQVFLRQQVGVHVFHHTVIYTGFYHLSSAYAIFLSRGRFGICSVYIIICRALRDLFGLHNHFVKFKNENHVSGCVRFRAMFGFEIQK
jgi:hypothetical protein